MLIACCKYIFTHRLRCSRGKVRGLSYFVTAKSGVSGCDNYRGPGPGVCLRPGSCYTVVTWHCVTLSRCHEHGVTVFITWSRQKLLILRSCYREWPRHSGECHWWWPIMTPHNASKETKIWNRLKFYDKAPIDQSCTTFVRVSDASSDPAHSFLSPGRLC